MKRIDGLRAAGAGMGTAAPAGKGSPWGQPRATTSAGPVATGGAARGAAPGAGPQRSRVVSDAARDAFVQAALRSVAMPANAASSARHPAAHARRDAARAAQRFAALTALADPESPEPMPAGLGPKLLEAGAALLDARGVGHEQVEVDGRPALRVLPDPSGARLSVLAARVVPCDLRYDPIGLVERGHAGGMTPDGLAINLSHPSLLSGRATETEAHELLHLNNAESVKSGQRTLFAGMATSLEGEPLTEHSPAYPGFMSLDEVATYALSTAVTANRLRHSLDDLKQGRLPPKDAQAACQHHVMQFAGHAELGQGVARQALELVERARTALKEGNFFCAGPDHPNNPWKGQVLGFVDLGKALVLLPVMRPDANALLQRAEAWDDAADHALQGALDEHLGKLSDAISTQVAHYDDVVRALGERGDLEGAIASARQARRDAIGQAREFRGSPAEG